MRTRLRALAENSYRRSLRNWPDFGDAAINLALTLCELDDSLEKADFALRLAEAAEMMRQEAGRRPSYEAYTNLGLANDRLSKQSNQPEKRELLLVAREAYAKAVIFKPMERQGWLNLASVNLQISLQCDLPAALDHLKQAEDAHLRYLQLFAPDSVNQLKHYFIVVREQGFRQRGQRRLDRFLLAESIMQKLLKLEPQNYTLLHDLAHLHILVAQLHDGAARYAWFRRVIEEADAARKVKPTSAGPDNLDTIAYINLAKMNARVDTPPDYSLADASLRRAAQLEPDRFFTQFARVCLDQLIAATLPTDEALRATRECVVRANGLVEKYPDKFESHFALADCLLEAAKQTTGAESLTFANELREVCDVIDSLKPHKSAMHLASLALVLGEEAECERQLYRAMLHGTLARKWDLCNIGEFEPLHDTEWFKVFLAEAFPE